MQRASWRQQGDAACLVEATGRCGVPRGGSGWDAMCLREATGRSNVPRKGNMGGNVLQARMQRPDGYPGHGYQRVSVCIYGRGRT